MPLEKSRTPERDLGSTYLLNSMQIHEYIPQLQAITSPYLSLGTMEALFMDHYCNGIILK